MVVRLVSIKESIKDEQVVFQIKLILSNVDMIYVESF